MRKAKMLEEEINNFLSSLKYKKLANILNGDIYSLVYTNLSRSLIKYFDSIDATKNITLNIRRGTDFIQITGYIGIKDIKPEGVSSIWIEQTYK